MNLYRLASKAGRSVGWHKRYVQPHIYLTFDDGPTKELTPWILDLLHSYDARATFFCLGRQVQQHTENYQAILDAGHAVGNHTYSHLNGWTTSNGKYFEDIDRADRLIDSNLFRPPYGRIRPTQYFRLRKDYRIVFWDVLSRDYDPRQSPRKILDRIRRKIRPGLIVVFHDSLKAESNLNAVLPEFLRESKEKGYAFQSLSFSG